MKENKELFIRIIKHPVFLWGSGIIIVAGAVFLFADVPISRLFVMTEHFMYEYDHKLIEKKELFSSVCVIRIPLLFMILLIEKSTNKELFQRCLCFVCGFSMGYLFLRLAENYGFKGVCMCMVLWMPHMFFYLFSAYHLMYTQQNLMKKKLLLSMLYFIGILAESYLNPILVDTFVTVF